MNQQVDIPRDAIAEFCRRHHIRWLAVLGSILRGNLQPDSDIDILVEFGPHHVPGLFGMARMERELSALLGGKKGRSAYTEDLNCYFREILQEAKVQYAQG